MALPREPNVEEILKDFSAHCEKTSVKLPYVEWHLCRFPRPYRLQLSAKDTVLQTTIAGLGLYFERSVGKYHLPSQCRIFILLSGTNLLYRFERGQYAEVRRKWITGQHVTPENTRSMSQVYGAEHLLRMLGLDILL